MPARTIYISGRKYLAYKNKCLEITDKETGVFEAMPMAEIGLVIVDSLQATVSSYAMAELAAAGVGLIFCDKTHSPVSTAQPIYSASVPFRKVKQQIETKKPVKKRLWKQIVRAKIANQISALEFFGGEPRRIAQLKAMLVGLKSGDKTNIEGAAAGVYFRAMFGDGFRRDRDGGFPNNLLNFTYMVARANITRSIVAAGLSPMLGIHHKNDYNPYTLSDDLIEPYRPLLDAYIIHNMAELSENKDLRRENKAVLLGALYSDVEFGGQTHVFTTSVTRYIESYARCIAGKEEKLETPKLCS